MQTQAQPQKEEIELDLEFAFEFFLPLEDSLSDKKQTLSVWLGLARIPLVRWPLCGWRLVLSVAEVRGRPVRLGDVTCPEKPSFQLF